MNEQRHRIRRHVLELHVPGEGAARPLQLSPLFLQGTLQRELSRIHRLRLAPLIDRCLTEASRPDRLHRIESLEIDLGAVDLGNLERDLVDKLGVRLREALAERLREEEHQTLQGGGDGATASRLELVAFFARTGCLPWWADTGDPRLLDESLDFLVENAPRPLAGWMRQLARDRRHLRRIVLHGDDAVLARLLSLLVPSLGSSVAELPRKLTSLLQEGGALSGATSVRIRNSVWQGALLAACLEGSRIREPLRLWNEVLAQIALETGVTSVSLVTGLRRASRRDVLIESLYQEIAAGQADVLAAPEPRAPESRPEETRRVPDRLRRTEGPLKDLSAALRPIADHLPVRFRGPWLAKLKELERLRRAPLHPSPEGPPEVAGDFHLSATASAVLGWLQPLLAEDGGKPSLPADVLRGCLAELRKSPPAPRGTRHEPEDEPRDASLGASGDASVESPAADAALGEEIRRILERWEQTEGPLQGLSTALRSITDHLPVRFWERWLAVLRELSSSREGRAAAALPREDAKELTELLRNAIHELPSRQADERGPLDLSFSDADEAYVENSGLVILWPFLGRFFERLDLLQDERFRDESALRRGVGLLQYVATEDPLPREYLLPLNKVLCGMEVSEVFDFDPPVSDEEAEECTNLLSAVIAHAPILHEMSTPGFRGSFLLRKGVLGTRDGVYLLRVERQTFDVVLDRFPWSVSWVRLPWMKAPLRVEW